MRKRIGVIGGGAAGIMAAITAARAGAEVTLYERNERVGKKLLSTGNGKCNFSNTDMSPCFYFSRDMDRALSVLERFDNKAALRFFHEAGMLTKEKRGGLYPAAEQASVVLDVLRLQLQKEQVELLTGEKVKEVRADGKGIEVISEKGSRFFQGVIIACGGRAAPQTGSDGNGYDMAKALGHSLVPVVPALVQLKGGESWFSSVSGVRAETALKLMVEGRQEAEERGELQFTDYGLSGIVVFQMSRIAAYALRDKKKVDVCIDFLPDCPQEAYEEWSRKRLERMDEKENVEAFFTGMLHKKLMSLLIRLAGLKPGENCKKADKEKLRRVFALCRELKVSITDSHSFTHAQVCAGGLPLSQVTENLESLKQPGVYFAGEILDVDGKCGGYNLQWAWASGYVAGKSAAESNT